MARISKKILAKLKSIKVLILDVDGVLTNGHLYCGPEGEKFKSFYVSDGLGIRLLMEAGVEVAVISGRDTPIVTARCKELGITHVYQGSLNKKTALLDLIKQCQVRLDEIAFMGDDIIDIPILQQVGFATAPLNAHPHIVKYLDWQSTQKGGKGAVRELTDLILLAKGELARIYERLETVGDIYKGSVGSC